MGIKQNLMTEKKIPEEFKELAKTIICTGYEFSYSHNASDDELDGIVYSWGEPLGENLNYSAANPSAMLGNFSIQKFLCKVVRPAAQLKESS